MAAAAVMALQGPRQAVLPGDRGAPGANRPASSADQDGRGDAAAALLERLGPLLERGTRRQVVALAAPGDTRAAAELSTLRGNVRRLAVTDLSLRYVDEAAGAAGAGRTTWAGQVQLTWRISGFDRRDSIREVRITFRRAGDGARFVTARGAGGGARPLWLLHQVHVQRAAGSLVMTTRRSRLARFSGLAARAVVDVRKVLRGWRGQLVVEVPSDQAGLDRVLGTKPGTYREIAAVTTTVDGTLRAGTPVHVFVNPAVFDPLGPRGSQIVMSHEATHVAVGAAFSSMPTWLLEGFADYVALAHVDLPVSVTASQILAEVRKDGPPAQLPGAAQFDAQDEALGATYESAWLACRLLAATYGEDRLLRFYRTADRSPTGGLPFRTVFGTTRADFTRIWRGDLRRLAG